MCTLGKLKWHMVPIIILVATAALESMKVTNNAFKILYYCVLAHEAELH